MRLVIFLLFVITGNFVQAQVAPLKTRKFSSALIALQNRLRPQDSIEVIISTQNSSAFVKWAANTRTRSVYAPANAIRAKIARHQLAEMANDSAVVFVNIARKPKEEFVSNVLDVTLNNISYAHRMFPAVDGKGLHASLKEQRFDTSDIDIKGRYFNSNLSAPTQSSHASAMASLLGGAGNSVPTSAGVATAVRMTSSDFETLLPDNDLSYDQFDISVQNHSYGVGIENFYGADAAAYDASVLQHNGLVHIFSSGNSGLETPEDGTYKDVAGFANLTGSFKMAKNIITVGATDSFGLVMAPGSKGPAYDGRVKPDLVAFGEDGTSGAAALVSGAALLVQDLFKQTQGRLPQADLTKAVLLNSANNKGGQVNFSSGYGNLDVNKALSLVRDHQYFEGEIDKDKIKDFTINVPAGITKMKVMIVWSDPPAAANVPKALINDLDAVLSLPSANQAWLPWVADHTPGAVALKTAAVRKKDTLNNVEQITIDDPASGNYTLSVNASKIVTASQKFAVVYTLDSSGEFLWTFPTKNDRLATPKKSIVRWQTNIPGSGTLEYSFNGHKWEFLKKIDLADEFFEWNLPDTMTTAKLRVTMSPSHSIKESEEFVISPSIDLRVGFNCGDSSLYYWHSAPNTVYEVYELGNEYLEPVLTTTDSFFIIRRSDHASSHFAVAPKLMSRPGFRSFAVDYTNQGVECYFQSFFASMQDNNKTALEINLGTLFGIKEMTIQKLSASGPVDIFSMKSPDELNTVYEDNHVSVGVNSYRVALTLLNGSKVFSPVESVNYFSGDPAIVFPNPVAVHQSFTLISKEPGVYAATVLDLSGRVIFRSALDDVRKSFPASGLGKGIYVIRFSSSNGNLFTKKLVVY